MKLWKTLLVVTTAIILPLALVSVGYAQELNCWGLRPIRTDEEKPGECSSLSPCPDREESEERTDGSPCHGDIEPDNQN